MCSVEIRFCDGTPIRNSLSDVGNEQWRLFFLSLSSLKPGLHLISVRFALTFFRSMADDLWDLVRCGCESFHKCGVLLWHIRVTRHRCLFCGILFTFFLQRLCFLQLGFESLLRLFSLPTCGLLTRQEPFPGESTSLCSWDMVSCDGRGRVPPCQNTPFLGDVCKKSPD